MGKEKYCHTLSKIKSTLITVLLFMVFIYNGNGQTNAKSDTSLSYQIDSIGSIRLVKDSSTLKLLFTAPDSTEKIIELLNSGDSLDLDGLDLNQEFENDDYTLKIVSAIRENRSAIAETLNLNISEEGLISFPVETSNIPENNPPTPPLANGNSHIIDRYSFVINGIENIISVLQTKAPLNDDYKIAFQRSINNQNQADTFFAGKTFYQNQFSAWIDLKFPNLESTTKVSIIQRVTENISSFQINNATQRSNLGIAKVLDSIEAEELRPRIAGKLVFSGPLAVSVFKSDTDAFAQKNPLKEQYFLIENIRASTDYNRISDLRFTGTLIDSIKHDSVRISFSNKGSLGFGRLNSFNHQFNNTFGDQDLYINPKRFITYEPVGSAFSLNVRNEEVSLDGVNRSAILHRRTFSDYISLQIFLDPLGFFNDLPNGFTQIEGTAYVPMNNKNNRKAHWGMKNVTSFSYVYTNAISSEPRFVKFDPSLYEESVIISDTITSPLINNLDFIKNYFYQLNTKFTLFSLEAKGANAWFHFNSGFRLLGSRIGPNRDSLQTYHKLLMELISVGLELRPDRPFGLNVDAGFSFMNSLRRSTNKPKFPFDPQFLYSKSFLIPHELNFYHYLSERSKGGLFFRYAGYLNFNKEPRGQTRNNPNLNLYKKSVDYFPLILIGYSTNISALVKGEILNRNETLQSSLRNY